MIPSDGDLVEPRPIEFDGFYRTLAVGVREGCQVSPPLAYIFLPCIILLYLSRRLEHLVPQTLLPYAAHFTATTLIAWGLLWHVASTLTDPRVKYMVVFMLLG